MRKALFVVSIKSKKHTDTTRTRHGAILIAVADCARIITKVLESCEVEASGFSDSGDLALRRVLLRTGARMLANEEGSGPCTMHLCLLGRSSPHL